MAYKDYLFYIIMLKLFENKYLITLNRLLNIEMEEFMKENSRIIKKQDKRITTNNLYL